MRLQRVISSVLLFVGLVTLGVSEGTAQNMSPPSWLPTDSESAERMAHGFLPHSLKDAPFETLEWTVDVTTDSVDANPGDSLCADASGDCSLRAAIIEANAREGFDIITLPAGTFTLTITEQFEDSATGDLDITGADGVQISGHRNGTIIDGGGLDRVFDIVNSSAFLNDLTITNGGSPLWGGGIQVNGSLSLFNVTVSENTVFTGSGIPAGAGIVSSGTLYVLESLVSNNETNAWAAGIYIMSGSAFISNSTISGNEAGGVGAGLMTGTETFTELVNVTITNNTTHNGGGIYNLGVIEMRNSILASNTGLSSAPDCLIGNGSIISQGYNLIGNNTDCGLTALASDLVGTGASPINPMLAPLANNGGLTYTHATLPGSPARDVVPLNNSSYQDQRGVRRPQEGNYDGVVLGDIGAFEFALPFIPLSPLSGEMHLHNAVSFSWTAKSGETQYRLEVKAPGTKFKFNKNVSAANFCQGVVCKITSTFLSIPNHKTVQWRVIANTAPKSTSPWIAFSTHIPGIPQIVEPSEGGYVADTTPTIVWNDLFAADKFTLKLINVNSGTLIKKFNLTANSTPSRSTACVDGLCTLTTDDFGTTLVEGRTYALVIESRYRASNAAQTKFVNYVSKSAKRTFNVIADPGLIALPAAPDLRSSGK